MYFANTCALRGATCAQVFYGIHFHMINVYGMKSESEMPEAYKDFIHDEGVPRILCCNNSQIQKKGVWTTKINWEHFMKDQFTEPNHPQQKPTELRTIKILKDHTQTTHKCYLIRQVHPEIVGFWLVNMLPMSTIYVLTKLWDIKAHVNFDMVACKTSPPFWNTLL